MPKPPESSQHLFGPSGAKSVDICPNYWQRPDKEEHPVTAEGTFLHNAIESGNLRDLDESQTTLVEMCLGYVNSLSQPDAVVVEKRFSTLPEIRPGAIDRVHLHLPDAPKGQAFAVVPNGEKHEAYFVDTSAKRINNTGLLERDFPRVDGGASPLDIHEATHADLIDWKFGWHAVEDAETNKQGWLYALGLFLKFPSLESVKVHFLQPRINYITVHTFTRARDEERLMTFAKTLVMRVKAGNEYNVNLSNCCYCDVADCPAWGKWAETIAVNYDDKLFLPEEFHPSQIDDPAQMDMAYQIAQVVERWAGSVKRHALEKYHQEGMELPNFDIKFRKGSRKIISAQAAAHIMEELGVPQNAILEAVNMSVTGAEKVMKDYSKRGEKQQRTALFFHRLDDLGALEEGGEVAYFAKKKKA